MPRGVLFDGLAEGLIGKRRYEDYAKVSHFGYDRYEILVKTERIAQELNADPVIKIKETQHRLTYLRYRTTRVSVFYYPIGVDMSHLERTLSQYGRIVKLEEASYKKHNDKKSPWGSGVYQVCIEMERAVPNYIKVNGLSGSWINQCRYQGVVRVCRKCGREGHLNSECNTPKCVRCGCFGRTTCEGPYPRCFEDHVVFSVHGGGAWAKSPIRPSV